MQVGLAGGGRGRFRKINYIYLHSQRIAFHYISRVGGGCGCVCVAEELYYYSTLLDDDKMRQEQLKQPAEGGYRVLLVLMGIRFYTRGRFSIPYYYFGEGNQIEPYV